VGAEGLVKLQIWLITMKIYLYIFIFITLSKLCWSQTGGSSCNDSLLKANYLTNYNSTYSQNHFSLPLNNSYSNYTLPSLNLKLRFSETVLLRPVYYNIYVQSNYMFIQSNSSYKRNALNPWGASDPFSAVMTGSLNYAIQAIDRKYFYGKQFRILK